MQSADDYDASLENSILTMQPAPDEDAPTETPVQDEKAIEERDHIETEDILLEPILMVNVMACFGGAGQKETIESNDPAKGEPSSEAVQEQRQPVGDDTSTFF